MWCTYMTLSWRRLGAHAACFCRYLAYLFFQLYTHHDIYVEEDDGEQPTLSLGMAFLLLGGITVLVAFASE